MTGDPSRVGIAIQPRDLARPVGQLLQLDDVNISGWNVKAIGYAASHPASGGLFRVTGSADEGGKSVPWSLVLKIVSAPDAAATRIGEWPSLFLQREGNGLPPLYWAREVLAYRDGLLNDLPEGLSAPQCLGVIQKSPTLYWLWLEDLVDTHAGRWTLSRYVETARQLGRFNGAYLVDRPLPDAPWLRRNAARAWLDEVARHGEIERVFEVAWKDQRVRETFPPALIARLRRCWEERASFLDALDCLPHTFCHGDAFPANIFVCRTPPGDEKLVAIDWSEAGIGAVGEEIATLVLISYPFDRYTLRPEQLDGPVFTAYVRGLRDAGWHGDEKRIRLGYAAAATTRKALLDPAIFFLQIADGYLARAVERRGTASVTALLAHEATAFSFALDLADEARELMHAT